MLPSLSCLSSRCAMSVDTEPRKLHESEGLKDIAARQIKKEMGDLYTAIQDLLYKRSRDRFGWNELETERSNTKGKRKLAPSKQDRKLMIDKVVANVLHTIRTIVELLQIEGEVSLPTLTDVYAFVEDMVQLKWHWEDALESGGVNWSLLDKVEIVRYTVRTNLREILRALFSRHNPFHPRLDDLSKVQPTLKKLVYLIAQVGDDPTFMNYHFGLLTQQILRDYSNRYEDEDDPVQAP